MEYIEKVILATGGAAAPEEILVEEEIIEPEVDETEAALEKTEDDPCWSGYIQIGMKEKNGKSVPNCVPSASAIDFVISDLNTGYGSSRQVTSDVAYSIARNAYEKYSYLENDSIAMHSAILWDVHTYAEYALNGTIEDGIDLSEYAEHLPAGHPATESSLAASAVWIAGAPELDNSGREALVNAFSEDSDYVKALHSSTRIRAMISSGALSQSTLGYIQNLSDRYSKVN